MRKTRRLDKLLCGNVSSSLLHVLILALMLFIRFVDRDMFMRFLGYGIGHKGQANLPESLTTDHDDDCLEEDRLDSQNIECIKLSWQTLHHGTQVSGGHDDPSGNDSDYSNQSDDEDDIEGSF